MKKTISVITLAVSLAAGLTLRAQTVIPDDPEIRVGKLESGMTYYLYHSGNTKGCADFFIAHNVGAMQEEDNQNGLAHFLEHMAFNGTRHYPGKGLLQFLDKEGVRFGYNVNAYTSRYETVYNISNVPLVRESFVDSVLLILHDWSCDISCEQQALDDERGVISEEWRLRDDPRSRMYFKQNSIIYEGERQADRTVVGTLEVINGFKRDEILDFYHTWYRPDLQAIFVVGDIDVDAMEKDIRRMFSDIPAHPSPRAKDTHVIPVPPTHMASMPDPSTKLTAVKIMCLQPYPAQDTHNTEEFLMDRFSRQIVSNVLTSRFKEKTKDNSCPARSAVVVTSDYRPDFYLSLFTVSPRDDKSLEAPLEFAQEELERMARFGISEEEFNFAKAAIIKSQHLNAKLPAGSVQNSDVVKMCIENFLRGFPCVTPSAWRDIQASAMKRVDYAFVSKYPKLMFADSGKIYAYLYNESRESEMPDADRMTEIVSSVSSRNLEPAFLRYGSLDMSVSSVPGSIVSDKPVKGSNAREWKLSNGATVYWTRCRGIQGEIKLSLDMDIDGGYRCLDQKRIKESRYAVSLIKKYAGFRGYDRSMLRNYPELSGMGLTQGLIPWERSYVSLTASETKIEDSFKYLYLSLAEPCLPGQDDIDREREESLKALGMEKTGKTLFKEKYEQLRYDGHPWMSVMDTASVEAVTPEFVSDVFRRLFCNFKGMEIYIAGDVDESLVKDCVCKYIASLDADYPYKQSRIRGCSAPESGFMELKESGKAESAPLCSIDYEILSKLKYTPRNAVMVDILDYVLSMRYLNLIREERGGTYHIDFTSEYMTNAKDRLYSEVAFQTRPQMRELLLGDVYDVMDRMCAEGPSQEEFDAAVKYLIKHNGERRDRISKNVLSLKDVLKSTVRDGFNPLFDYRSVTETISPSDIRSLARSINKGGRMMSVYTEE